MTRWTFIRRSLRFHARSHVGVLLGAAVAAAVLTGALVVGDSMRQTLLNRALSRLGPVQFALSAADRLFLDDLGTRLQQTSQATTPGSNQHCASVLFLTGTAARQDGTARLNRVNVLGVKPESWAALAGWGGPPENPGRIPARRPVQLKSEVPLTAIQEWEKDEAAFVNEEAARQLRLKPGDEIVLRLPKPTALAQDAVISPREENIIALRLRVGFVLRGNQLGDFSLVASQVPPANIFVPQPLLQKAAGVAGRANLLVSAAATSPGPALERSWRLEDAQLTLSVQHSASTDAGAAGSDTVVELSSRRIFLEPQVVEAAFSPKSQPGMEELAAARAALTNGTGMLTYLANLLQVGTNSTPYSMVTAAEAPYAPAGMADDEILLNEWVAHDLRTGPGDRLLLTYYVVDSGARLQERTNTFKVRAIVPIQGRYADRSLMPEFPGLAKAESTHDWDAGFPLVHQIRPQDEAYWKQYRGTPKAFVTLSAGQRMWANRFGSLTAVRWPVPENLSGTVCSNAARLSLRSNLDSARAFGFLFQPVRELALKAATQAQDFGQLFLGFSFFLIVAALLLMALLFQFGLEQRATEIGTLLALGFLPRQVRRLFLLEGVLISLAGGVLGALGGIVYAKAMLWALVTHWRSAVGTSVLDFHMTGTTLATGALAATAMAGLTIWLSLRRQARQPAVALLTGNLQESATKRSERKETRPGLRRSKAALACGLVCLAAAVVLLGTRFGSRAGSSPGAFFGAGSLLLVSGLSFVRWQLTGFVHQSRARHLTLAGLGVRAVARRRNRSLATIALLSCGAFIIVSLGVFRLDSTQDFSRPGSGTGGFSWIGDSTLPVIQDLNTRAGREALGLSPEEMAGITAVSFRERRGEDASCLNLNRAQTPRLLGIRPELLAGRFTFAAAAPGLNVGDGWSLLKARVPGTPDAEEIPAIGDANSIQWALGKSVGDTLDYTDEHGHTFKLRLVGALANSILQGNLIIDEEAFTRKFPSESGYRFFLFTGEPQNTGSGSSGFAAMLTRGLQDYGLQLTPAAERLNAFNAVQNTYLGTFQILGGLGLLLGSAGLGILVLRNVLERRGELALLTAVGFGRSLLQRLVLAEHWALLAAGLGLGLVSAFFAVLPALLVPGKDLPMVSVAITLAGVLLNGSLWTLLATRYALRGELLPALRNE